MIEQEAERSLGEEVGFRARARFVGLRVLPHLDVGQQRDLVPPAERLLLIRNFRQGGFAGNFSCHPSRAGFVALFLGQLLDRVVDAQKLLHQTDVLCSDFLLKFK